MIMMKKFLTVALLAGATAVAATANAEQTNVRSYAARQAISHSFGSKRVIGFFAPQNGACALTAFVTEAEEGYIASSAARIKLTVKPGETAEVSSAEGQGIEVKCRPDAAAVEVRPTSLTAAVITQ